MCKNILSKRRHCVCAIYAFAMVVGFFSIEKSIAQVAISAGNTVTESFTIGTSATATLPSGWKMDKNATARLVGSYSGAVSATEQRAGNSMSSSATNGLYNFASGDPTTVTDRALGGLSSSSASKSVNTYVYLANNGATSIQNFTISYNVEKYRNGSNAAGFSIQMYYSTDGSTWTSAGSDFLTSFAADTDNNGYASAPGATVSISSKNLPVSLGPSASLYLAWNYSVTSGTTTSNAQALGIDDVSITANASATPTIDISTASLTGFNTFTGTASSSQNFTVSGDNLTANVSLTAPTGFEISIDNSSFISSLDVPVSGGNVTGEPKTVYARIVSSASAGAVSGDINLASTGAGDKSVACSGTVYKIAPTLQASNLTFTAVSESGATLNWTVGDGDKRVVKVNTANSFTNPTDGTDPSASTTYVSGEQVVYSGSGSSVTISGLSQNTTYWVRVFEYNNASTYTKFITSTATDNPTSFVTPVSASATSMVSAVSSTEAVSISSLTNNSAISTVSDGAQVWKFRLYDGDGTNNDADALPTKYNLLILEPASGNSVSNWSQNIRAAGFFEGSSLINGTLEIESNSLSFTPSAAISVPDGAGSYKEITLRVSLKNPLPAGADNAIFAFNLNETNTGTETSATSSQLGTFNASSDNSKNKIAVVATQLLFSDIPTSTGLNTNFNATVSATDANGNIDLDATNAITLVRNIGSGTLSSVAGLVKNLVAGVYSWSDLQDNTEETFTIRASASGFTTIETGNIICQSGLIVGTGTALEDEDGYYGPLHNYWENNRSQMLFIQSELGSAKTITNLSINIAQICPDITKQTFKNFAIYLKQVSITSVSTAFTSMTGVSPVYSSASIAMPVSNGWQTFDINDFAYDGSSNLLVEIRWGDNGEYVSDSDSSYRVNMTQVDGVNYYSIYGYDDATSPAPYNGRSFYRPNLKFLYNNNIPPVTDQVAENKCLTSMDLEWNLPENYNASNNTILVFAKEGSLISTSLPTANVSTYTADADFSGGGTAYQQDASAKCVYKGDGTNVSIAGLTSGATYYFKVFNVSDPNIYSAASNMQGTTTTVIANVASPNGSAGNGQVSLAWTLPISCYDEIMIVAKPNGSITTAPSGDGTAYTADLSYGSGTAFDGGRVVYKGASNNATVTTLTNGTQYYFKFFTRKGSLWSTGIEIMRTPVADGTPTVLDYGDLVIVGVNANNGSCSSVTGEDVISFFCFKDIGNGTTIDITDNGWERKNLGQWGNTEGGARFTRTGGLITAGTIITFKTTQGTPNDIVFLQPDNSWTVANLGTGATKGLFSLNNGGDQIYIMQGGTWNGGTASDHDATYTNGRVLFGFSTNTWTTTLDNLTTNSKLYPHLDCFNMSPTGATDYNKYIGPLDSASQRDWIDRINNRNNWAHFSSCGQYADSLVDNKYENGKTVIISQGGFSRGQWVGSHEGNGSAWCNCSNWQNLIVPDSLTDVIIPEIANNDIELSDHVDSIAVCRNLTLRGKSINGKEVRGKKIRIFGDLTINGGNFDFNGSSSADGAIDLYGNFTDSTNGSGYNYGKSMLRLVGTSDQTIRAVNSSSNNFYHLFVAKPSGNVNLANDILISDSLSLISGNINAGSYLVTLGEGLSQKGLLNYSAGYIIGKMKRWFDGVNSGSETGLFPIGTSTYYRPMTIDYTQAPSTGGSLTAQFVETPMGTAGIAIVAANSGGFGRDITQTSNDGYWRVDNQSGTLTDGEYSYTATLNGANGISDYSKVTLIKRVGAGNWLAPGVHVAAAGTNTSPTISRTGLSGFSNFGLGNGVSQLPVALLNFGISCENQNKRISWQTASEINNSHFILERSYDYKQWISIAQINGAGNSSMPSVYSFLDEGAEQAWYRLSQVDFDGNETRFKAVESICNESNLNQISVFPNPVLDWLSIVVSNKSISFQWMLTDASGKIVLTGIETESNSPQIDMRSIAPGVYLLKVICIDGVQQFKIIKQ